MCEGFDMVVPIFFAVQVWYQMTASATTCNWVSERIGWFLNHLVPRFCSICQKYSRSLVAKCFLLPTCNLITKNIHCCFQKTFPIMRCSSPSRMNESTISWGRRTCWVRSRWHPFCKERVESKFSSMREHLWIRIRNQKNITVFITLPTGCRLLRATHSEPWTQMEKEASYLGSLPVETKFKKKMMASCCMHPGYAMVAREPSARAPCPGPSACWTPSGWQDPRWVS